ncbi:hypothetical protein KP509_07G039600 [Ceratopteris richardii]|uniref:HMA domain-containing protein n=1 Tax=Ceratopteris richardii TaxID=49495 RepID=A0A8T2UKC9_CERRI|nr:hypothetical protein KP509_07G039600 [Ceratopteris richardii]
MGKPQFDHSASKIPSNSSKSENAITLKVLIHCEGCKRKVKNIIKCVDGVESVKFEVGSGKVIVLGKGVDVKDVLRNLHEAGKHAEVWHLGGFKGAYANHGNNANNKQSNGFNKSNANNGANNNMKGLSWDNKGFNNKGKANGGMLMPMDDMNTNLSGKMKGELVDWASINNHKPHLSNVDFRFGQNFEKPGLVGNNIAILSKSMAPVTSVVHGETGYGSYGKSEYGSIEYATHFFSDENVNNCSVM